jgi:hypothetical protein
VCRERDEVHDDIVTDEGLFEGVVDSIDRNSVDSRWQ